MTEEPSEPASPSDIEIALHEKIDAIQTEKEDLRKSAEQRIIHSELRVEAMRAGIIDLDGLKFIDSNGLVLRDDGSIPGCTALISELKFSKPWLFRTTSSSSLAKVPLSKPVQMKHATEMTDSEYREAKSKILRKFN